MRKTLVRTCCAGLGLVGVVVMAAVLLSGIRSVSAVGDDTSASTAYVQQRQMVAENRFDLDVLVDGRPVEEYYGRGRAYVEAVDGAEYELRIRNPLPYRVAVALSVDGLNSIDARRTSAWNASKWVIEPYGTIHVGGWQMSSDRARRFYFTRERDSYAAKLGQTSNLGVISAVFFREIRSTPIPITPPPRPRPMRDKDGARDDGRSEKSAGGRASSESQRAPSTQQGESIARIPDDDYAATGIGRSVRNDVRWVNMDLDSRPAGEVTIRYEYYDALVRLGIMPRPYYRPDPLRRREGASGFENRRFSPEP